ncbi:MAG: hypothetical protein N2255_05745, partial [Kiritimatiellae bacterium]|nr:hypothetical protein [Kiritimatiellia bacterium]
MSWMPYLRLAAGLTLMALFMPGIAWADHSFEVDPLSTFASAFAIEFDGFPEAASAVGIPMTAQIFSDDFATVLATGDTFTFASELETHRFRLEFPAGTVQAGQTVVLAVTDIPGTPFGNEGDAATFTVPSTPAGRCNFANLITGNFSGTGSTVGAIDDYDISTCATGTVFSETGIGPDIAYAFRSATACTINVSVTPTGAPWDVALMILSGCSNPDLFCMVVDDNAGAGISESIGGFTVEPGKTYFIIVDGFNGAAGNFNIEITTSGCSNTPEACDLKIDFDESPATAFFFTSAALRDEYLAQGVRFRGPGPLHGGADLNDSTWNLLGNSDPNQLSFSVFSSFGGGGAPVGPQTIEFIAPKKRVSVNVAQDGTFPINATATLTAYDIYGASIASKTASLSEVLNTFTVESTFDRIKRVELSSDAQYFVADDLCVAGCNAPFAIGSRVILLEDNPDGAGCLFKGATGTIVCNGTFDYDWLVEWDSSDCGHDGQGFVLPCVTRANAGWYMYQSQIAPICGEGCVANSLFSRPPHRPNEIGWDGYISSPANNFKVHDYYFIPSGTEVGQVTWWGAEVLSDYQLCSRGSTEFEITFRADSSGSPGAVVYSEIVDASSVDTGLIYNGSDAFSLRRYSASLTVPVTQQNGWISIVSHNDTDCYLCLLYTSDAA